MRIKSLAQGENILMLGIEPSTFVSKIDILTTTPIVPEGEWSSLEMVLVFEDEGKKKRGKVKRLWKKRVFLKIMKVGLIIEEHTLLIKEDS